MRISVLATDVWASEKMKHVEDTAIHIAAITTGIPPSRHCPTMPRPRTRQRTSARNTEAKKLRHRLVVQGGSATSQLSSPAGAAAKGKIVLAWHAGFASRWLDPQEHDGTATPDNFLTALHDALVKNQGTQLYDHPGLAERYTIAADAKSATFTLREE